MFFLRFPACLSSYYPIQPCTFIVVKHLRVNMEPAAKYRFSPYPPLLSGLSAMSYMSLRENGTAILFTYKLYDSIAALLSVWLSFDSQQSNEIMKQRSIRRLKHNPFPIMVSLRLVVYFLNFLPVIFSIGFKF